MKKNIAALALLSIVHTNFAMQGKPRNGQPQRPTVADMQRVKPETFDSSVHERGRRLSISEEVIRTNKIQFAQMTQELQQDRVLSDQAAQERFEELKGHVLTLVEQFGKLEKNLGELFTRFNKVESMVIALKKRSETSLEWPAMFDTDAE
jgi:hypothetical protein